MVRLRRSMFKISLGLNEGTIVAICVFIKTRGQDQQTNAFCQARQAYYQTLDPRLYPLVDYELVCDNTLFIFLSMDDHWILCL